MSGRRIELGQIPLWRWHVTPFSCLGSHAAKILEGLDNITAHDRGCGTTPGSIARVRAKGFCSSNPEIGSGKSPGPVLDDWRGLQVDPRIIITRSNRTPWALSSTLETKPADRDAARLFKHWSRRTFEDVSRVRRMAAPGTRFVHRRLPRRRHARQITVLRHGTRRSRNGTVLPRFRQLRVQNLKGGILRSARNERRSALVGRIPRIHPGTISLQGDHVSTPHPNETSLNILWSDGTPRYLHDLRLLWPQRYICIIR